MRFIICEGYEGAGKSTLAEGLHTKLSALNIYTPIIRLRFPSSLVRTRLLERVAERLWPMNMAIFIADMAYWINILNGMKEDPVIILDRSWVSTAVYQASEAWLSLPEQARQTITASGRAQEFTDTLIGQILEVVDVSIPCLGQAIEAGNLVTIHLVAGKEGLAREVNPHAEYSAPDHSDLRLSLYDRAFAEFIAGKNLRLNTTENDAAATLQKALDFIGQNLDVKTSEEPSTGSSSSAYVYTPPGDRYRPEL